MQVLKGITRVYAAKRAAALRQIEEQSRDSSRQHQLVRTKAAHRQQRQQKQRVRSGKAAPAGMADDEPVAP